MTTDNSTHAPINISSEELEEHFEFIVDLCHREGITFMFEHNKKWMCLVPYEEFLNCETSTIHCKRELSE